MSLAPAPDAVLGVDGVPRFGAYAGSVPRVDFGALAGEGWRGALQRRLQRKRWQYGLIVHSEVMVGFAMVDLGYAANGFCFVADRTANPRSGLTFDRSFLGGPVGSIQVGSRPAEGARSSFGASGVEMSFRGSGDGYAISLRVRGQGDGAKGGLVLDAKLGAAAAPPPLTLIAPVPGGRVNVTQKAALLPVTGELSYDGGTFDLAGAYGGLDYTHGLLARETAWRWAFAAGQAEDGTPIAFNLVEGFNQGTGGEDAVWTPAGVESLPPCRFEFHAHDTLSEWRITSEDGRVDLRFTAIGEHREERNLLVARSRFIQVAGDFAGHIRLSSGRIMRFERLGGVTEDQAVRW